MKLADLTKEELIELIPEEMKVDEEHTVAVFLNHKASVCLEKERELSRIWSDIDDEIRKLLSGFTPDRVVDGKKFYYGLPREVRDKLRELVYEENAAWRERKAAWEKHKEMSDRSHQSWCDLFEKYEKMWEKVEKVGG